MKHFMKAVMCAALITTASVAAKAQELKPFKVAIGIGYATPGTTGAGVGGGALFFLEPGYRASDNVLVNLRLESAIIARGVTGIGDDDIKGNAESNFSYSLNVQYFFSDNYVRPFVGAGAGLFSLSAVKFNTANPDESIEANEVKSETKFGFYPRIGIDAGHFTLSIDYNIIPKTDIPGIGKVNNSYLGIRAGFSIGGGVGEKQQ